MDNLFENLTFSFKDNLFLIADQLKQETNRLNFSDQHLNKLFQIIQSFENKSDCDYIFINVLKIIRNSCIACPKNNHLVVNSQLFDFLASEFINTCNSINENLSLPSSQDKINLIINGLQCFGNMVSGDLKSSYIRLKVNEKISFQLLGNLLVFKKNLSIPKLSTFVIYNLVLDNQILEKIDPNVWINLSNLILENIISDYSPSEWSLLCIEHFLKNKIYLPLVYPHLNPKSKLILLDVIFEKAKKEKDSFWIDENNLTMLLKCILNGLKKILENQELNENKNDSLILQKLFSIFGQITIQLNKWIEVEDEKNLICQIIDLLKIHHLLSKNSKGLKNSKHSKSIDVAENEFLFFELKKNLVQILANLSYQNFRVQEICRKKDAIPLILDMFQIDDNNPFLREWCVFALRNLLENNLANQEIVFNLRKEDVIVDEKLLSKFGLKINQDKTIVSIKEKI